MGSQQTASLLWTPSEYEGEEGVDDGMDQHGPGVLAQGVVGWEPSLVEADGLEEVPNAAVPVGILGPDPLAWLGWSAHA